MRIKDIETGAYYHDGKLGVREVVSMQDERGEVTYKILSAKVEREYNSKGEAYSIVGTISTMTQRAFSSWAKTRYDSQSIAPVLLAIDASRVRLTPAQSVFMREVLDEVGGQIYAGLSVTVDADEKRVAASLQQKGLVIYHAARSEIEFTDLGEACAKHWASRLQVPDQHMDSKAAPRLRERP